VADPSSNPAAACPVLHGFDALAPDFLSDPYPYLSELREESPVFYDEELEYYLVTRYDDMRSVMADRDRFSASNASSPISPVAPEARAILDAGFPRVPTLNNTDPPRHTQMRKAVLSCLPPRRFAALEPGLREYAGALVDDLVAKPVADLVADFSFPFPAFAAFSLIGIPPEDTDMIREWCGRRVLLSYGRVSAAEQVEIARDVVEFWDYTEQFVNDRHRDLGDDFTSDLLRLSDADPERISVFDIMNIVYSMALAGHETTMNAITNAVNALLVDRERWEALCADPTLVPGAVEEGMRFDTPIITWRRLAKEDTDIGGVTVPAGAKVMLMFGSGHYDPSHFADPEVFDPTRSNASDHLAFGHGSHFCLGAPLARLECKIALELLTAAAPEMRLVDEGASYTPTLVLHGIDRLVVEPRPS
jgi:cytochrome P450